MKMSRRTFLKRVLSGTAGILGIGAFGYSYARYLEPHMLQTKTYSITSEKIPRAFHNFKVLQFSDTHLGFHYDINQLNKLSETINGYEPDLLLFTGDLVDKPHTYDYPVELVQVLRKLEAKRGKYWIYGNHDHGGYGTDKIRDVMDQGGFQLLQNEHILIRNGSASFALAGLDDVMLGKPDIEKALNRIPEDLFTLLMVHEPDVADDYQRYPIDLQLSGHSHGGQVQLPFYGYMVTPPYAEKYVEGHYRLEQGLDLYVSRGIGTTRLPYRFLCQPEISLFLLKSNDS
ncbi:UNVERIFIED_CONTAM: metallophosphoesterase [Halobacillus marinus]|uniref:metallophosphoesterase n=1 Tax=Bacillaceae TaxID=186817 RepID=UPI000408620F|nr:MULTISPECIES: metallophosphoesterase [Bacillaceae]QHT46474.1 metallophosphoesterase [Bacillus sp. SB49]